MEARKIKVEDFLSSPKTQFVIPVYQRNYDWQDEQCKQLFEDIIRVGEDKEASAHFIGSIVYLHEDPFLASAIKELIIIDGQQRLTTLTLIFAVIHRLAIELKKTERSDEIWETYLINKFASEEGKLKLRPTENHNRALQYVLRTDTNEEFPEFSNLVSNFDYFKGKITGENYECVLVGLSKLMFVEISLERGKDDPQRIFESLNSTGLDLSQADLIRNYILMGLNRRDQERIYQNYWEVIEKFAKDETQNVSKVSDFIRDYLTLENKKIPTKENVYQEFRKKYPIASTDSAIGELEGNLSGMKNLVKHYYKLINPGEEPDRDICFRLEYISRLKITVAFPFLMKVYDDYSNAKIEKETFAKVLDLIQSFVCRRFILNLRTNSLNKIFMNLYDRVDASNYLPSIQQALLQKSGQQRYPKDAEVVEHLRLKDIYDTDHVHRAYLLERLENFENHEPVLILDNPDITVEHIFPQNPDPQWKMDLGSDEYADIQEKYLNTVGNLTLVGANAKLGNMPFLKKRDLKDGGYKDSRLWLNKHLATLDKWDKNAIENRFDIIKERFLKIWEYPKIELPEKPENGEVTIFEAESPTGKKLEYAIFLDKKIEIATVTDLYIEIFKRLFEHQPETFFSTDLGKEIGLAKNPEKRNQPRPISDTYFIDCKLDNIVKFDRIKLALTYFKLEEELVVKYEENV